MQNRTRHQASPLVQTPICGGCQSTYLRIVKPLRPANGAPKQNQSAFRGSSLACVLAPKSEKSAEGSREVDVGVRMADLGARLACAAGSRIELDLEIGVPGSLCRIVPMEFDQAILHLIDMVSNAGAHAIILRSRKVGRRIWIVIARDHDRSAESEKDPNRLVSPLGLDRAGRFAMASHGKVLTRHEGQPGAAAAMVLPTVLRRRR